MAATESTQSPLTTLKRKPERGDHSRAVIDAILDEGLVAHVGIVVDGQPFVIPMVYGRDGNRLVLHGSVASRLLRALDDGVPACATVTIIDELVLARSWFHHSMNYRSVVVLGTARRVRDPEASRRALETVVEHIVPGRTAEARAATDDELRQTAVLELPIDQASAKRRTGPPVDEPDDLALDVWGGTVPVRTTFGTPAADGLGATAAALPASLTAYRRPGTPAAG
jgi:uncharacterized protein